jgi:hypothetical protein
MSTRIIDSPALQQREFCGEIRGELRGIAKGKIGLVLRMFKFGLDVEIVNTLSGVGSSFLEKLYCSPDMPLEEAIKLYYSMFDVDKK